MISRYSYDRTGSPIAMVAEDDDGARMRIAGYLREQGYRVLEARTSVEALLLAIEFPDRIDMLFTSLDHRKYCNGVELAGCLRVSRPKMAVFYLCGNGECSEDVTREIGMGQAMLLRKPVSDPLMDEAIGVLEEIREWAGSDLVTIERI